MLAIAVGTVLPWLLIAVGAWLGYQLVLQNGRILLRLEAIEEGLAPRTEAKPRETARPQGGLAVGAAAPDFELPDLKGGRHQLADFRGRNLLLMFFDPKCGFCTTMAAELAALPPEGDDRHCLP